MTIEEQKYSLVECDRPTCGFSRKVGPGEDTGVIEIKIEDEPKHFCISCVFRLAEFLTETENDLMLREIVFELVEPSEFVMANLEDYAQRNERVDELLDLVEPFDHGLNCPENNEAMLRKLNRLTDSED